MTADASIAPSRRATVLLVGGSLALAAATVRGRGRKLDDRLFAWVNSSWEHPALDRVFASLTELGSLYASGAAAAVLAAGGRRKTARDAIAAAGIAWLLGQGLKKLWRRARPFDAGGPFRLLIGKPQGTSWPSSHPMVLLTFVTVAARDLGLGATAKTSLNALAGAVAASRVYLGVHYPADIAGGLLLGRAVADAWSQAVSRRTVG